MLTWRRRALGGARCDHTWPHPVMTAGVACRIQAAVCMLATALLPWHPPQATAVTSLLLACIGWLHQERVSELCGWHASRLCCRDPGEWGPQPLRGTPAYRNATGKTGMRRGSASRAGASQNDLQALPQAMMR